MTAWRSPAIAFASRAMAFARSGDERDAIAAVDSTFTGLARLDVRAIVAVARGRATVLDTIERGTAALPHDVTLAARRAASALRSLRRQPAGESARATFDRVRTAFELDRLDRDDLADLDTFAAVADEFDRRGPNWTVDELMAAYDARARRPPVAEIAPAAPLPHREPEPARAAAPFTGHFSASSLTAFVECARKWYYRYLCNVVDDPGSSASFYGTAFHAALERFHQNFPRVDGEPAEVLEQRLDGAIVEAFDPFRRSFGTPAEFELQLRRARRTAKHYLRWVRERARTRPFSVVATEAKIELLLDGREFVGYIDRLDRDDATGDVTVIDYKTGAIAQSAAEYRAGIVDQVEFQLPLYYWARTAAGDRVRSLTLVPLKDALADVRPIELEIVPYGNGSAQRGAPSGTISIGELERARGRMAALAEQLATGAIERFATTTDPTACTYCAYRNACRERPHDGEERFGR